MVLRRNLLYPVISITPQFFFFSVHDILIILLITTFYLRATIAKLYFKVKYIVKERVRIRVKYSFQKNSMIPQPTVIYTIRYHQESSQRKWAFFPSKCIIFGCFNSIAFQACQEDDPCYKQKKKKKQLSHSFLGGKL